jgi:osmotically-inducible protein OsmY
MVTRSRWATCSRFSSMTSRAGIGLIVSAVLLSGCASTKQTVGLDVDVYLHPSSSDSTDVLLQAGIDKRLADTPATKNSLIHVRVFGGIVTLTGTVKSQTIREVAEQITRETELTLNGTAIRVANDIRNQIEVER